MITNTGKGIIAKYLLGQAPAYASHMAIGCGRRPLVTTDSLAPYQAEFSQKESMDMEMFRIPIISRGYVTEPDTNVLTISDVSGSGSIVTYEVTAVHGFAPGDIVDIAGTNIDEYNISSATVYSIPSSTEFTVQNTATGVWASGGTVTGRITKLALTAELPTEQRYEISEVGLYSGRSNPSATNKDSRMLYTFAETENWEYHNPVSAIGIGQTISTPLSAGVGSGIINPNLGPAPVFRATSDNAIFDSDARLSIYERCRFLNSAIYIPGNISHLQLIDGDMSPIDEELTSEHSSHIHLAGTSLNLSKNSAEDELRLAFSIINKDETFPLDPSKVYVMLKFSPEEDVVNTENFAKFQVNLNSGFDTNRYIIATNKLGELVKGAAFSWGAVSLIRAYVSVFNAVNVTYREYDTETNTATITTEQPHGMTIGSPVTVALNAGTNNLYFNGNFYINDVPSETTFTYHFVTSHGSDIASAACTGTAEGPTSNFFVALDALRLENVSTLNPLYGLTGYTVIKTDDGRPIVKEANTSNLIEFRFGLDVM